MEQLGTQAGDDQYRAAFATVRAAKNWFWWVILLALVIQIAGFILVRFVGVIDAAPAVKRLGEPKPVGQEVAPVEPPAPSEAGPAELWYQALHWLLPATKFIALVAGMLLVLTLMFSVKLSLAGRTGGIGGYMGAFFWSLLLWAVLIPWQQVLRGSFACGALSNLGELVAQTRSVVWNGQDATVVKEVLYHVRFLVYPLFAVVLQLVVQAKFARGYRRMTLGVTEAAPAEPPASDEMM